MATIFFQKGLQYLLDADRLTGAGGSPVSGETDFSGNGRHAVAASNGPVIEVGADGRKSVAFDGTNNPLVWNAPFNVQCGFILAKIDGLFTDSSGLVSPIASEREGILRGVPGTGSFYDFRYKYYSYRLNDLIYSPRETWIGGEMTKVHQPPAPIDEWGIIYFERYHKFELDGLQIGKDRSFAGRLFKGRIRVIALYERGDSRFCSDDIRAQARSIAYSYALPVVETFPVKGSRGDEKGMNIALVSDGQREPITREHGAFQETFDVNFSNLKSEEHRKIRSFYKEFYPSQKRFVYRDLGIFPHEDVVCRFPVPTEPKILENLNQSGGALPLVSSIRSAEYSVPLTQPEIENETNVPTEPVINYLLADNGTRFLADDGGYLLTG